MQFFVPKYHQRSESLPRKVKLKSMFSFKAKVIEPCSKLVSKFKLKFKKRSLSLKAPTFRMPKQHSTPCSVRTRAVRFRKPFSLKGFSFSQCRSRKLRKRQPATSPKFRKALHHHPEGQAKLVAKPVPKVRIAELLTVLFSLRKVPKEVDTDTSEQANMADVTSVSVSEGGQVKEPFPSPITPAYARINTGSKKDSSSDDLKDSSSDDLKDSSDDLKESSDSLEDVEDVCRSFESYLVEMIVDEGSLKDLMDVEELLYCWRNLKTPIFIDLVCRFYGELCEELFSPSEVNESH